MTIDKNEPLYTMSAATKLLEIRPESIRAYEEEGLIKPARTKETKGGKRLYSQNDIDWIKFLRKLIKDENLSMSGIRKLLLIFKTYELNQTPSEKEKWSGFGVSSKSEWALMKNYCEKIEL